MCFEHDTLTFLTFFRLLLSIFISKTQIKELKSFSRVVGHSLRPREKQSSNKEELLMPDEEDVVVDVVMELQCRDVGCTPGKTGDY